MENFNKENEL